MSNSLCLLPGSNNHPYIVQNLSKHLLGWKSLDAADGHLIWTLLSGFEQKPGRLVLDPQTEILARFGIIWPFVSCWSRKNRNFSLSKSKIGINPLKYTRAKHKRAFQSVSNCTWPPYRLGQNPPILDCRLVSHASQGPLTKNPQWHTSRGPPNQAAPMTQVTKAPNDTCPQEPQRHMSPKTPMTHVTKNPKDTCHQEP